MDYKDLRSIQESYTAMYSEEVVDEGLADMVDKATKAGQSGLEKMGVKINRTSRPTARPSVRTQDTMRKNQSSMEEVEVFDIVKGHLIDEHNLSEDVALQLMNILDEEIKADILEYTAAIRADAAPKGTTMRMSAGGKEPPGDKMLRGLKSAVGGFLNKINPKAMKSTPVKQRTPLVATPKNEAYVEEVDVFDIIKGHLIDEGFADTEEAALAIMTNMSEDWKQSIVEGPVGEFADGVARTAGTVVGGAERVIKKGPGYLKQKLDNVKSTFDSARERTRENIPPNATKKPAAKSTPRPTPGGRMVKGNSTGPSAQSAVKRGGQSQHMGRDVPGADGPIRR